MRTTRRPQLERLAARDVPAALSWSIGQGELVVLGTPGQDGVTVSRQDDRLVVALSTDTPADGVTYSETFDLDQAALGLTRLRFTGLGGNDSLMDSAGLRVWADLGAGDDEVLVLGDSTIYGGAGDDRVFMSAYDPAHGTLYANGGSGFDYLVGGEQNDTLIGGPGPSWIYARGGDDLLLGGDDSDCLIGDSGNDRLFGYGGSDWLYGNSYTDDIGNDWISAGDGDDWVFGNGLGNHTLYGGAGNDYMIDGAGNDRLYGDAGDDSLFTNLGDDRAYGGSGDDLLSSSIGGRDWLYGDGGNDTVFSTTLTTSLVGGSGYDYLTVWYWSADYSVSYYFISHELGLGNGTYWSSSYSDSATGYALNQVGYSPRDWWDAV